MRMRVRGGASTVPPEASRRPEVSSRTVRARRRQFRNVDVLTESVQARGAIGTRGRLRSISALSVLVVYLISLQIYYISIPTASSSLLDESLAGILVFYALRAYLVSLRLQYIFLLFAIYAGLTLVGNLIFRYGGVLQPWAALLDMVLDLKPFLIEAGFLFLFLKSRNPKAEMESMCIAIIVLALANSALVLYDLTSNGDNLLGHSLQFRNGLYQPVGFQAYQVRSAALTMLGATFAIYFAISRRSTIAQMIAVYLAALVFAHQSVKELATFLLILPFFLANRGKQGSSIIIWVFALFGLSFIILATPVGTLIIGRIAFFANESGLETARTLLLVRGFEIATDHFPFGSGGGTFGSAPSYQLGYSDLYYYYGMNNIYGATRDHPSFLQDAYWGKILGQSGFSGTVVYMMLLYSAFGIVFKLNRELRNSSALPACAVVLLALMTSTASSPFSDDFLGVVLGAFSAYALSALITAKKTA